MLRLELARRVARSAALGVAGTGVASCAALAVYTNTEQGLGLRREIEFWRNVTPIVWDYWWNASSSSPSLKFKETFVNRDDKGDKETLKKQKKELLQTLHLRNAPKIFQVMLNLGGLYVKLGQVLSVTALPIPEQYREHFRKLQSNVPGHEDFEKVVKPTLEKELGAPLDEIFDFIDEIPCGAASIGQAHRAALKETKEKVIVKVQYPDAKWQVPADIDCVGDFLKICVWFGLVDESASNLSYQEFSRQFLAELDYEREKENLQQVYESSLDPDAPYIQNGVVIPRVFDDLCTKQIITMTFLPGPKFEEEAKHQLQMLGIDTKKGIRSIVNKAHEDTTTFTAPDDSNTELSSGNARSSWKLKVSRMMSKVVSVDSMFSLVRFGRRMILWSTVVAVRSIQAASRLYIVPSDWEEWANQRKNAILQADRLVWTEQAVHALLDVHGYQIMRTGLFNADPHPGNILVVQDENNPTTKPKIGLIDYGQCKRLTPIEQLKIAKLIVSIADRESDEVIAGNFRNLGIKTKNNSTRFLADFGRLMFGSFEPKHFDHSWHTELHKEDRVLYFPKELSMVYRTSLLLRGLAMSLQFNPSVGEQWRHHAQYAIDQHSMLLQEN
jgi:aarF domain-containing kinase